MTFRRAWYVFGAVALIVIVFELFFRFHYVQAGNRLWRLDRVTEQACLVRVGEAICSAPAGGPAAARRATTTYIPASPTPEPNLR
jgi:hypothetical protein